MKKFWCVLLSLAALLSFTSLAAYAAEPEEAPCVFSCCRVYYERVIT